MILQFQENTKEILLAGLGLSTAAGPLPAAAIDYGMLPGLIVGRIIGSELQRNNQKNRRPTNRLRADRGWGPHIDIAKFVLACLRSKSTAC